MPLFNEVQTQKLKFNSLNTVHLDYNQIMCPYCRTKNNGVLPFHEELNLSKIYGVNTLDPTYKIIPATFDIMRPNCISGKCEYSNDNPSYECTNKLVYKNEDGKTYCHTHKMTIIFAIITAKKQKAKQDALAAKATIKAVKEAEKLAEKLAKNAAKIAAKTTCVELLKSGKNKGQQCGCKAIHGTKCGRHHVGAL